MVIGYTAGVFDLFHIGHLNLLRNAKGLCDRLIVGVTTDELVWYKHKAAVIPYEDRAEIVRAISFVDAVIPQEHMDKLEICKKIHANILFVGDDWYQTKKWQEYEREFCEAGIAIVYFTYTKRVSSTKISHSLDMLRREECESNG